MKNAMGAVIALAFGIGLAAAAQANGITRQSAVQSPNLQSGTTQQMQEGQVRPQRQAIRQVRHKRTALARTTEKTRMATLKRHSRTQLARLHKTSKTRLALHRQNRNQNVGIGSSTPNSGNATITPTTPNSAGGTPNLNTPTQNQ
jgi:hypothetical protein